MRCPQCGTENAEAGSKFCQRCGAALEPGAMQMQQMGAPPAKKGISTTMIIVLVVVAIVVIVIVAGAWVAMNSINRVSHGDIEMSVTNVAYPSNVGGYAPASGQKFVQLTVLMTNSGDLPTVTAYMYFTLKAVGGAEYTADYRDSANMSTSVLPGSTQTLVVTFQVPSTAVPEQLVFEGIFGNAHCDI